MPSLQDSTPTATPGATRDTLILASTSVYRAQLLARLGLKWDTAAPGVTEAHQPGEAPPARASRLADEKAGAVATFWPGRWVLASDQVCACDGQTLDKPGDIATAREQLRQQAGRTVEFHTAITLLRLQPHRHLSATDRTIVRFRALSEEEITRYVTAEPALDCAGSFKCEALGISLCQAIETRDPTALVGLPLIAVCRLLAQAGIPVP